MSSRVLVALRIAAPRERVFEAFTREIHLWWRPHPMFLFSRRTDGRLAIEPELGGRFTETYADGTSFTAAAPSPAAPRSPDSRSPPGCRATSRRRAPRSTG